MTLDARHPGSISSVMFACNNAEALAKILGAEKIVLILPEPLKEQEVEKNFKVPVLASIPLYNFEPVKTKGGKKK